MSKTRWRTDPTSRLCVMRATLLLATIACMEESLRGQLLIATPSLFDYFRRTVVLVLEHTEEGAMGVVLNRSSEAEVVEAVPALGGLVGDGAMVRIGGPVSPDAVVA